MKVDVQTFGGAVESYEIDKYETIADLKRLIEARLELPRPKQVLTCLDEVLKDNKVLIDLPLGNGEALALRHKEGRNTQLIIRSMDNERVTLYVSPEDTIRYVKGLIHKRLNFPTDIQAIYHGGQRLEDGNTVGSYGLTQSEINYLEVKNTVALDKEFTIFVKTISGGTLTLIVKRSETILSLKKRIETRRHIDANQQRLIFGGKELADNFEIGTYDIGNESTLHLVLRLRGGN